MNDLQAQMEAATKRCFDQACCFARIPPPNGDEALNSGIRPTLDLETALVAMHPVPTPVNILIGTILKCHYPTAQLTTPRQKCLY